MKNSFKNQKENLESKLKKRQVGEKAVTITRIEEFYKLFDSLSWNVKCWQILLTKFKFIIENHWKILSLKIEK